MDRQHAVQGEACERGGDLVDRGKELGRERAVEGKRLPQDRDDHERQGELSERDDAAAQGRPYRAAIAFRSSSLFSPFAMSGTALSWPPATSSLACSARYRSMSGVSSGSHFIRRKALSITGSGASWPSVF